MQEAVMHLLQISDTHLFKDSEGTLLGCNTCESFDAIIRSIKKDHFALDLILLTGDLSHDGSPESYLYIADALKDLKCPVCWIPGNHDVSPTAHEVLGKTYFLKEKELSFKNWSILLMDSQLSGEVCGHFTAEELAELEYFLTHSPKENLLITLHHQPLLVGSQWLDGVGLRNREQFQEIILCTNKLRTIVFGHVHQEFDRILGGVRYLGAPSTCIQFLPNSTDFGLDKIAPGYRYIQLKEDGSIETIVKRLENYVSRVDFTAAGY